MTYCSYIDRKRKIWVQFSCPSCKSGPLQIETSGVYELKDGDFVGGAWIRCTKLEVDVEESHG